MKKKYFKNGMTLVELLVAIAIMSLGMVAFTILAARTWSYKGYVLEQATAVAGASRTLNKMVHELRTVRQGEDGSYPIKETTATSLTVHRNDDEDTSIERVRYFVDDGEILKKGVTKFVDGAYASENETVEVLLNYVTNITEGKSFFFYYDNDYPIPTNATMANANPYDVRLVRLHLWINVRPIVAPENVNLESVVEFRNLNEF